MIEKVNEDVQKIEDSFDKEVERLVYEIRCVINNEGSAIIIAALINTLIDMFMHTRNDGNSKNLLNYTIELLSSVMDSVDDNGNPLKEKKNEKA